MITLEELRDLHGRRALITGAAGRLGKIIAETLAEAGSSLILVDLPNSGLEGLVQSLKKNWDVDIEIIFCDLELQKERQNLINLLIENQKDINVLINNAAFVGSNDLKGWNVPFSDQSVETWKRAFEVNTTSIFEITQGLAQKIKNSGNGSIINIASIYGVLGPDYSLYEGTSMGNPAAYSSSKGALIQLTRWLSTTLAPNIRVNAISPGGIFANQPKEFVKRYESKTPLGRMGNEDDLKGIISFLSSDLSMYVTGQNFMIDGGWSGW